MARYAHQKYTWTHAHDWINHRWELVGPLGALHLHVGIYAGTHGPYGPSAGLEFHHTEEGARRVGHWDGEAPHHLNCPMTGGRCWHDGTSLYAETVWGRVKPWLEDGDHDAIFRILEGEADRHFHPATEEA